MKESKELKNKICDLISRGLTVDKTCNQLNIAKSTLYEWVYDDKDFRAEFDRAKDERIEAQLEEATQLLDDVSSLEKDGFDKDRINAARLKVDTIKWFASKRLSKIYGDKTIHSNDPDNPMPAMQIYCPKEENDKS